MLKFNKFLLIFSILLVFCSVNVIAETVEVSYTAGTDLISVANRDTGQVFNWSNEIYQINNFSLYFRSYGTPDSTYNVEGKVYQFNNDGTVNLTNVCNSTNSFDVSSIPSSGNNKYDFLLDSCTLDETKKYAIAAHCENCTVDDGVYHLMKLSQAYNGTDSYAFYDTTIDTGWDSNFLLNYENAAPDTCTYGGSGDWEITISDNCVISSDVDLGANKLIISGDAGTLSVQAEISAKEIHYTPTDFDGDFIVEIQSGGSLVAKP